MFGSRRRFLSTVAAGVALRGAKANPLGKSIGLQLYMVDAELTKDFGGTLDQVAQIGIKEVEIADLYGKRASDWKTALQKSGLHCRSVHVFDVAQPPEDVMRFAAELGAKYVVTSLNAPAGRWRRFRGGKVDWPQFGSCGGRHEF